MKIKPEHYAQLKSAVEGVLENNPEIHRKYQTSGLSDKRYRWDLLWASKFNFGEFYNYLDDTHIDSALRKITDTK